MGGIQLTNYEADSVPHKTIYEGTRSIQNENFHQRKSYDAINKDRLGISECVVSDELDNIERHTRNIQSISDRILDAVDTLRKEGSE